MKEEQLHNDKRSFIVCDIQREYAEHLLSILSNVFSGEYEFHYFENIEKVEHTNSEILLIDERSYEKYDGRIHSKKLFILTEQIEKKSIEGAVNIFRYQSSDEIIRMFKSGLGRHTGTNKTGEEEKKRIQRKGDKKIRDEPGMRGLIGVYSPVHRIGKTNFALRLGKKMARTVPVLYLNMEGYSGQDFYFNGDHHQTLADLLYYIKQERTDYGLKISSMTGQYEHMDYIHPMTNEYDLRNVKKEEWMELFRIILEQCIYEAVILDLGDCIHGLYDILEMCDKVYTPYISSGISMAKIDQYENNLKESGHINVLKKTVKKQMKAEF